MEIEDIRQELNQLLNNVVDHSTKYSGERPIPSLEISFVLSKINKMQERLSVLRHLLEQHEKASWQQKNDAKKATINQEEEVAQKVEEQVTEADAVINTSLESNLDQPSISSLIDALTLNDRYLYANELFNKDMNSFNELVKSLEGSSSIDEAKAILSKIDWDYENEHVLSFVNLVERRFL